MTEIFRYQTTVRPEWIDYNGHMQDAYYGLIFSYAVDGFQDAVGFDRAYRERTGCTIYLLEDHKRFLREVKEGAVVEVETRLLDFNDKCFHLWSEMKEGTATVAVSEMIELHVQQRPTPHGTVFPSDLRHRMSQAVADREEASQLPYRARRLQLS